MLTAEERLQLQQLRLLAWAEDASAAENEPAEEEGRRLEPGSDRLTLTTGLELHPWQREAVDAWFDAGRRGTIKVVTGAGKTIAALAIAERLTQEDPELRMAIVVPTIVLMEQWSEVLVRRARVTPDLIGRLGGGKKDDFDERRVLVAVLASARKDLPAVVRRAGVADHLLLVVDESHRAGAPEMAAVLDTPRAYSLGLSATPERSGGDVGDEETERLQDALGGVVYELTFADAIRDGILPPFEIHHFGLSLTPDEARRYQALTHSLAETRRELTARSPAARKAGGAEGLVSWARRVSGRRSGELSAVAWRFVNDTTKRKQLLYRAHGRTEAALTLVREELERRRDARVILFHESIDEVVGLYETMVRAGLPAVMEHSRLPAELRSATLDLFRAGTAQVVVSARSLIEGFDVPEADLGIVVASSSSPRQRIQSIGRVLRKHRDADGEEKTSRICVLYMRDTVDEAIYEKQDWDRLIGLDRNRYLHWDLPEAPVEQEGPPRSVVPPETEIDFDSLSVGDRYPGRYSGAEYSTDQLGNVLGLEGSIAANPQDVPVVVSRLRGRPGRFRVTLEEGAILVRVPVGSRDDARERPPLDGFDEQLSLSDSGSADGWITVFGGLLDEPFRFAPVGDAPMSLDVAALAPGDLYPGPLEPSAEYRFRQRAGGMIAKRVRGGELFARGRNAERLVGVLKDLHAGGRMTRIFVNSLGHAFWRERGEARFLLALDGDLEFPADEK